MKNKCLGAAAHISLAVLALALMQIPMASAGPPFLVRNINSNIVERSSNPIEVGRIGQTIYYSATDGTGAGLWTSDGTEVGTRVVKRFTGGGILAPTGAIDSVTVNDRMYFAASQPEAGAEVWVSDGTTEGTKQVVDLLPGSDGSNPQLKGSFDDELVFVAFDAGGNRQVFLTDGTGQGTRQITTFTGTNNGPSGAFAYVEEKFYFAVDTASILRTIWVSDGTVQNTRPVINSFGSTSVAIDAVENPQHFRRLGSNMLYTSSGQLYRIDMPTDTIYAVTEITGAPGFGPPNRINAAADLVDVGGAVVFLHAGVAPGSFALWRSDGTDPGTSWVAEVNPGLASFNASQFPFFRKLGNRAIFQADDGVNGQQLWSTDGTSPNTVRLTNATQPANESLQVAVWIATVAGRMYFTLPDGATVGTGSLWVTDGTPAGTRRVGGLPAVENASRAIVRVAGDQNTVFVSLPGPTSASLYRHDVAQNSAERLVGGIRVSLPGLFAYQAPQLYFAAATNGIGTELWRSDGTVAGTRLVRDSNPQNRDQDSMPESLVEFNGRLAFVANDGVNGRELWISDGTEVGTRMLADVRPGREDSNPVHLIVANGWLHFFADDGSGTKLMRINATGTTLEVIATLTPRPATLPGAPPSSCFHDSPVVMGGSIYFAARDGVSGLELWRSDGTAAGTRQLGDIEPGLGSSDPCGLAVHNTRVYFRAGTIANGRELWSTDGTALGTRQVADLAPGQGSSAPAVMTSFNGLLYFGASPNSTGRPIWKTDGTSANTETAIQLQGNGPSFANIAEVLGSRLILDLIVQVGSQPPTEADFWSSDGTTAGSVRLATIALRDRSTRLVNANKLFFVAQDSTGYEPWVTDGTASGTLRLRDINPSGDSLPTWFADFRSVTLFGTTDPLRGSQIWRTDGTEASTALIGDVPYMPPDAVPYRFANDRLGVGNHFFVVANDPTAGLELYAIANDAPLATPDSASATAGTSVTINVLSNDRDIDGQLDVASIEISIVPVSGTASVAPTGTVTYSPAAGFTGADAFTYTVADNQGRRSNPVVVTITTVANPGTVSGGNAGGGSGGGGGSLGSTQVLALLLLYGGLLASRALQGRARQRNGNR